MAWLSEIVPAEEFTANSDTERPLERVRIEFVKDAGRRETNEQQVENIRQHTIRTRYNTRIKSGMFFKFRDRQLNIRGPIINENEKNRWMRMMCEELT